MISVNNVIGRRWRWQNSIISLRLRFLEIPLKNIWVSWGVLFKGLGVQKGTQTSCWLRPCLYVSVKDSPAHFIPTPSAPSIFQQCLYVSLKPAPFIPPMLHPAPFHFLYLQLLIQQCLYVSVKDSPAHFIPTPSAPSILRQCLYVSLKPAPFIPPPTLCPFNFWQCLYMSLRTLPCPSVSRWYWVYEERRNHRKHVKINKA